MNKQADELLLTRRKFNPEKDREIISSWWEKHESSLPSQEFLPEMGLIIDVDNEPCASGFVYRTDSVFCLFQWFSVNPEADKKARDKALNYLIESVIEWARKANLKAIYATPNIPKMIERLKESGFQEADKGATHMIFKD